MRTLFILLFLLTNGLGVFLNAQDPFDCITAIEVCSPEEINIQYEGPVSGLVDENVEQFCALTGVPVNLEFNAIWLKYHFQSDGDFLFTITPTELMNDIDFVAFKSSTQSCDQLTSIRCMFSGEAIGGFIDTICLGDTGLYNTSIDTCETAGCDAESDNFLAPINIQSNDVIYLAILSWDTSFQYTVTHEGSAIIGCQPLSVQQTPEIGVNLFPNPATTDIWINSINDDEGPILVEVYDSFGSVVFHTSFTQSTNIDLRKNASGIYYVKTFIDGQVFVEKILKVD
ncbi:MAG: T9SS type A sorting domain-containing protein [Bacteroidota bacterium]